MHGPGEHTEISELFDPERLLHRRMQLHQELGRISAELCDAQFAYNNCIKDILATNDELRLRGIDTGHLAFEIGRIEGQETA